MIRRERKKMKRVISFVLILSMIFSFTVTGFAAEGTNDASHADLDVSLGTEDLSGELFSEVFGDGSDYQIIALELAEDSTSAKVSYLAAGDSVLNLKVIEESSQQEVLSKNVEAPAGEKAVTVPLEVWSLPEYFWIEAVLTSGGNEISQVFSYLDRTQAYQDFLATPSNDASYAENVILDFGIGDDGEENFAVVSRDVKVVYVDSMDQVEELGDSENAALFGLMEETEGYVFTDVVNSDVLEDLQSGDKLLVFPVDNVSDARVLRIEEVEEVVTLFSDGEEGTGVEVTASSETSDLGEFFEYIRVSASAEADAGNIDTSTADADIEFLDEIVVDPAAEEDQEADLFGSGSASGSLTKTSSLTVSSKSPNGVVKITDTLTLTANVSLSINYSSKLGIPTKLTKITASSKITAKNVFNVHASKSFTYKPEPKLIGTIPVGTVAGVVFKIPVYLTFSATFDAVFDFTATQTCAYTISTTYQNGSYSQTTTKSASSDKTIQSEAKVVVMLGIKASFTASFLKDLIAISVTGEVGVQATGTLQSINNTSTYRHNNVLACLTVDLDLYVIPSLSLNALGKTLASKTWSKSTVRLMTFYAHYGANGKWSYGTGNCPNRQYLITITVKDGSNKNKPLSGVTVKEGSTTLGTTNSSGQVKLWMSMAGHILKLSKNRYETETINFIVSSSTSKTATLYKSASNEEYWTMTELMYMSDTEWASFIEDDDKVSNTIFNIESVDELGLLSTFTRLGTRTTAGLRFAMNGAESEFALGSAAWTPIGTADMPFRGELDGNGFTISDLAVYGGISYAGLFGKVDGALIHDLTLEDVNISGGDYSGALAGMACGGSTIYDIAIDDGSVSGASHVGGIIGGMEETRLLNAYNTASVTGSSSTGGIAGSIGYTENVGLVSNCFNAGEINSASGGGICGTLSVIPAATPAEDETAITDETGIYFAYYLDSTAAAAVGANSNGTEPLAFAVTAEQANGTNTDAFIAEEGYANELTLLDALNNWYEANGAYNVNESGSQEVGDDEQLTGETTPNSSPLDYYNRWYADRFREDGSGGFPIFAEKAPTYLLSVLYVYEDGTQARSPVKLYKTAGQAYDVDTPPIEGYHTYELEYKGVMPAENLEYRVIYIANRPYNTMSGLTDSGKSAEPGDTFSISNEEELIQFAAYVNDGKNTEGVSFVLTEAYVEGQESEGGFNLSNGSGFASVGAAEHPFRGCFDGSNLPIENLATSLFGFLDGARISAVAVGINIADADETSIGAIIANAVNSTVENCIVEASINGSAVNAGGVVGNAIGTTVNNCSVGGSITVSGTGAVGGVVGRMSGGSVMNCISDTDVTGRAQAGGLVGIALDSAKVLNSCVTGDVSGPAGTTGGVAGSVNGATIANIYFSGASDGDALIGTAENIQSESLWFRADADTGLQNATSYTYDETGFNSMLNAMNEWVSRQGSNIYMTWSAQVTVTEGGEGEEQTQTVEAPPVIGTAYTFWIMNLTIENGSVSYSVSRDYHPEGTVWIAVYSQDDQMLDVFTVTEDGEGNTAVPEGAEYARAFVMDEDNIPLDEAITATK